ncbi:LysR family transcriptional regulator [Streptomyces sp. NPDC001820]|uniref:LysR family transcriptional regulator n=1 Tax=Streptomyces sp. NPDC001820 TaxID=3364613 RepID=UPI0036CFDB71
MIYESRLEPGRLLFADFAADVRHIVAQPFLFKADVDGKVPKHFPDHLLLTDDGPVVVGVKPRCRTLKEAAEELGIHHTALITRVGRLRREIGFLLLIRATTSSPMKLTQIGEVVVAAIHAAAEPEASETGLGDQWKVLEAWQLSEQITGCLLVMVVDAMSGMVTQVRLPRRDEMNAYYRALSLCDPGKLRPNRETGDANA